MWREHVRGAFRSLRAHKLRSLLTISSIVAGAFSIVFMSSLAVSGLDTLAQDIEKLGGARIIMIVPKKPVRALAKADKTLGNISKRDRDLLYQALPHIEERTMFSTPGRVDVSNSLGTTVRTDFVAGDAGFFGTLNLRVAEGRLFDEQENERHARVCILGHKTAKALFDDKTGVGQWLTVDGSRCKVIGILTNTEHLGDNFGFDWLDVVVMPFETAAETRQAVAMGGFLQFRTDEIASNDIVKRIANALLVERHYNIDDFEIYDFSSFMTQFEMIFTVMEILVGIIAGIALLVGGIGVMNMILVSVSQRTREIGIRKAIGASPSAIAQQFLFEALILSGLGGVIGVLTGAGAAIAANTFIKSLKSIWVSEVSSAAVIVALLASAVIGLGFGFVPARRAGRLSPVEAIRG